MLSLAGLLENSIVDGPGIRFVVFCQGCPHHCPGCQNDSTWAFEGGSEFSAQAVFEIIQKDPLVKGVTFSGGEPMCQAADYAELAGLLKNAGYEVACYTGYTLEQLLAEADPDRMALLRRLDILVDGPFVQAELSLELAFRGSRNQRILNMPQSLAANHAVWEQSKRWIHSEVHPVG